MRPRSGLQGGNKNKVGLVKPAEPKVFKLQRATFDEERYQLNKRIADMNIEHRNRMRNAKIMTFTLTSLVIGGIVAVLSVVL